MKYTTSLLLIYILILMGCTQNPDDNQHLDLSNGKVQRIENFKSAFISPRNIDVWLPDNYSSDKKYAVLYMHDGQMLFDSTRSWNKQEWGVDETMSRLLNEEKIRHTIVVGIWNTEFRHSEYFPQEPFTLLPKNSGTLYSRRAKDTRNPHFSKQQYVLTTI